MKTKLSALTLCLVLAATAGATVAAQTPAWDPNAPEHRIPVSAGLPYNPYPPLDVADVNATYGCRLRRQWVVSVSLIVSAEHADDVRAGMVAWTQHALEQRGRLILVSPLHRPVFVVGHFGWSSVSVVREFP